MSIASTDMEYVTVTLLVSWLDRDVRLQGQKVGGWGVLELESESLCEGLPHAKLDSDPTWTAAGVAASLIRTNAGRYRSLAVVQPQSHL